MYWTETSNITSITTTAGAITGVTMSTGTQFWEIEFEPGNLDWDGTWTTNRANGTAYDAQRADLMLHGIETAKRNEIVNASANDLTLICESNSGKFFMLGERDGMSIPTAKSGPGKTKQDMNGYTLNLVGEEKEHYKEVSSSIIAALLVPAV